MKEYDSPIWDKQPWICPRPDVNLERVTYDKFIRSLSDHIKRRGQINITNMRVECHGKCPKGCEKKFKLKLGKSLTKKSFYKIQKHAYEYKQHCMYLNYEGDVI